MDYNELYCRWAEATFGLTGVTGVRFDASYAPGCETCGDGDTTIEVIIYHAGGAAVKEFDINYDTTLINSLLEFNASTAVDADDR